MLTDPLTGKVVSKVEGDNHVFADALFLIKPSTPRWESSVNGAYLCMMDDGTAIDSKFPYLLGGIVGYGIPSVSGSGSYRGAYNLTNQVLAAQTLDSVRWLFQYDFTTAQANGTIKSVGLTHQFNSTASYGTMPAFSPSGAESSSYATLTNDGAYTYSCSTAGIITKHSLYFNTNTTIDISATVGTTSSTYKRVGYAPVTGKYYIYTYSSTASLRYVYVFSDSTFSTLEATFSASNIVFSSAYPIYIYENYIFMVMGSSIRYANFVNNTEYVEILQSTAPSNHILSNTSGDNYYSTLGYGKYIFCGWARDAYVNYIFDMSLKTFVGTRIPALSSSGTYPLVADPISNELLITAQSIYAYNPAITKYILPTPVVKTSDYGLTVTYELEVNWK